MKVEVMGPGCPRCQKTKEIVKEALQNKKITTEVEHISDMKVFSKRGVLMTPAVFINGEKKVEGRIPKVEEVEGWLE